MDAGFHRHVGLQWKSVQWPHANAESGTISWSCPSIGLKEWPISSGLAAFVQSHEGNENFVALECALNDAQIEKL